MSTPPDVAFVLASDPMEEPEEPEDPDPRSTCNEDGYLEAEAYYRDHPEAP